MAKGQISVFIIVGIVLIIIFGLLAIYPKEQQLEQIALQEIPRAQLEILPIDKYIEGCVDITGKKALNLIGKQGGYYFEPPLTIQVDNSFVPYYHFLGQTMSPTRSKIAGEISFFIDDQLSSCLDDFSPYLSRGLRFETGQVDARTLIKPNQVDFVVFFPVTVISANGETVLDKFTTSTASPLFEMTEIISKILDDQERNINELVLSTLADVGVEHNISVELEFIDDTVLLTLLDEYPEINEVTLPKKEFRDPHAFTFAIGYDWEDTR